MKPPKRSGKPRSFSAQPRRPGGADARSERVDNLRQDAIPTAALSPNEAQEYASWPEMGPRASSGALVRDVPARRAQEPLAADDPEDFDEIISSPTPLSDRRREKISERRRVRVKRVIIATGTAAMIILIVWILFFSSLLAVRQDKISISGLGEGQALVPAEITEAMAPWVGVPLLRLNGGAVAERLVAEYPLIKSVDVSRKLPHGLALDVSLREPVACLMEGETCAAIDAEGVKLDLPAEQANALPRLVLAPGQDQAGDAARAMIDVLKALPQQTRERVASIEVSEAAQMTLTLSDGAVVIWGGSQDNEFKAQVLAILLQQPATRYDVSAPRAPVTS